MHYLFNASGKNGFLWQKVYLLARENQVAGRFTRNIARYGLS